MSMSSADQCRTWLEFHDSVVTGVKCEAFRTFVELDAYVHRWEQVRGNWSGTGWSQPVSIILEGDVRCSFGELDLPILLANGRVAGRTAVEDLVRLPFKSQGAIELILEPDIGPPLFMSAASIEMDCAGAGKLVESLPDEWAPG